MPATLQGRAAQAWTIARIELRRAFFARRSLWVYALAFLPAVMFFGHGLEAKFRTDRLTRRGVTSPALVDSVRKGESVDAVIARLGAPADERSYQRRRRVRSAGTTGTTSHAVDPTVHARVVRLNITRPTYSGEPVARIYEFEVYGPDGTENFALSGTATGSTSCTPEQGPERAINGSVSAGRADAWCAEEWSPFLQIDLGKVRPVARVVLKHASAGGEDDDLDTRDFNIQVSEDGKVFTTVASSSGAGFVDERIAYRELIYFDGRRDARFVFIDDTLAQTNISRVLDFEEDRLVFAGIFQYFYLRLAIFFGCLGIFMYLFRGEMSNRTLHFWFLAPARREVLLVGKYVAGLIAAMVIFGGGAALAFAALVWPHDPVEVQAYWNAGGISHAFWYTAAAVLGCVGYGSIFLAVGLYLKNPIIPAAVLLAWESINGILPHAVQRMSILYYLQSLCPVPAPMDRDAPTLIQLLASPAAPASRPGAVVGLLLLTAVVLWIASLAVRRMQITYGTEA